jgi:hypothetical protein
MHYERVYCTKVGEIRIARVYVSHYISRFHHVLLPCAEGQAFVLKCRDLNNLSTVGRGRITVVFYINRARS